MPRVNIYIRKEDEKKWAALPSKAEFIHNALNSDIEKIEHYAAARVMEDRAVNKFVDTPSTAQEYAAEAEKTFREIKSCKHGSDPKFCKHAKNGKPCK